MSLDLFVKLITIPLMLVLVHNITAAKTDQSLDQLAVSVQYEALRDVAGTTYEESFYDPSKESEDGLEANGNDGLAYAMPTSYFDYAGAEDLAREQLLSQLDENANNDLSILDTNFTENIDGYINVLIAGGRYIEEDGSFFENALWGDSAASDGSYFSGLSGFGELKQSNADSGPLRCRPYASIQRAQSQLKAALSDTDQFGNGTASNTKDKLIDPAKIDNVQSVPMQNVEVRDLVGAVYTAQQSLVANAADSALDQCFIAQAKTVIDQDGIAFAPVKQMPNLAYYNYFFSNTDKTIDISADSSKFFLFRKDETVNNSEKRDQLMKTARENIGKWNAFQ